MIYYAIVRYLATGNNKRLDFRSEQERALCLVALGGYVKVLQEGISDRIDHADGTFTTSAKWMEYPQ